MDDGRFCYRRPRHDRDLRWGVEEGAWKGQGASGVGLMGPARVGLGKHMEGYHELLVRSSNYFDIIRMEWEGVEKAGVAGLISGVQEMAMRREAENFAKRGWRKKMEKRSKSACPDPIGVCGTQILAFS